MVSSTGILDLPVELLHSILSYLDVSSFLYLTASCKALHKPEFIQDSTYWSTLVRTTFRVPNQPVVEKDSRRWQKLYKRLLTQSRIYTWGNNEKACLGHSSETASSLQSLDPPRARHLRALRRRHIPWPEKMQRVDNLGVLSDLQCGGWSTTLLTAKGALYTVGVMDGLQHQPHMQKVMMEPVPLRYPPGHPHPWDRYMPFTAVKQFSAGRGHILALSDSGRIWSWQNIEHAALHVKFLLHDTVENGKSNGKGVVKKVVAGWNKSAALVEGTGIVLWELLQRSNDDVAIEDAALVLESAVVPKTDFREHAGTNRNKSQMYTPPSDDHIGEVRNFVILEDVVIFNTHLGKVFVAQIIWSTRERRVGEPFQLPVPDSENEDDLFVTDVQGSYQSCGVFTRSGLVLTSKQDRLMDLSEGRLEDRPLFTCIPALQHKNVIQLAFGDYHFHALHSPGYITSYGIEPQSCGALGLGGHGGGEGRLRGIQYQGAGGDGRLIPHAYTEGRRVWFEREKRSWIQFLTSGGVDPAEAMERERMAIGSPDIRCQGEVSEWVEQQGRDWERKFGVQDEDDDGLGAYFALSVTAAGWHSGALVLENDRLAEKLKKACEIPDQEGVILRPQQQRLSQVMSTSDEEIAGTPVWLLASALAQGTDWVRWFLGMAPYDANTTTQASQAGSTGGTPHMDQFQRGLHPINYGASPRVGLTYQWARDSFPRLRLSDGTEMPGDVPFDDWRYPRPEWDLDFAL